MTDPSPSTEADRWAAVGDLYHRYLTGVVLALVSRQGTARAAEVVFRTFRRQHLELFLPGLGKLGLDQMPNAVACAQYHVLSNALGGVGVVWIPESDTKSWVRYLPPRWIFDGTAVCGIPTEVSRAMLWGWHGHNGVTLDNDRLGFVCTMQTTDGQPGLEGYYIEEDEPLAPEDRVRFRPGEQPPGPPVELATPEWGAERLAKVERNYSMAYVRSILPELCSVLGPADGAAVGRVAGRQIGMQYHGSVMAALDPADSFADRFRSLLTAHGRSIEVVDSLRTGPDADGMVALSTNNIFGPDEPPEVFECWNGLWEGLAAMEGLRLTMIDRLDLGADATTWRIDEAS
ncbi:MAG: hypothetical protein GY939_06060 [Actinomycetia bacterium]|nr:hypothetical protein [Actinomycetes bacterium]